MPNSFGIPFVSVPLSNSSNEGVQVINLQAKTTTKNKTSQRNKNYILRRNITQYCWPSFSATTRTCKVRSCCLETHPASGLCQKRWCPPPRTRGSPTEPGTHTQPCPVTPWRLQFQSNRETERGDDRIMIR